MKKALRLLLVFCTAICLAGCSKDQKTKDTDTFFTALNHLFEAQTLQLDGNVAFNDTAGTFGFWLDQKGRLSLALEIEPEGAKSIAFYIRDGKTYLNYMGTKTQSIVQNIGLKDDSKLSLYNPFLNLNRSERAALFDSISRNGNEYTFVINRNKLQALLDSYGSLSLDKAEMSAVIEEGELKELTLEVSGAINITGDPATVALDTQIHTEAMNESITIPYPDDLEQYAR